MAAAKAESLVPTFLSLDLFRKDLAGIPFHPTQTATLISAIIFIFSATDRPHLFSVPLPQLGGFESFPVLTGLFDMVVLFETFAGSHFFSPTALWLPTDCVISDP